MKFKPILLNNILDLLAQNISHLEISRRLSTTRYIINFVYTEIYLTKVDILPFTQQICKECKCVKSMDNFDKDTVYYRYHTICISCESNHMTHEQFLKLVKELFDKNVGSREIAKQLNCTRHQVQKAYKELNIYNIGRAKPRTAYLVKEKICKTCNILKPIVDFRQRIKGDRISYEAYCLICEVKYSKMRNKYVYYNNKEKWLTYRKNNRIKINKQERYLYNNNAIFKLRKIVSGAIRQSLIENNSSKFNKSCKQYLEYSFEELKQHIENLWEPWMNWQNHGVYRCSEWNDEDQVTWRWQIDHIIPHSTFKYTSMEDKAFKQCWALTNLRPYSAKQNIIDGTTKIRHKNEV